jgi:hypothetical protein
VSYSESLKANRRLCMLKLLVEDGGMANESILEMALRALGHIPELDRRYVREQMRFLEEVDCVVIDLFKDKVMVATITDRGVAVARGSIKIDGIAQPGLGL